MFVTFAGLIAATATATQPALAQREMERIDVEGHVRERPEPARGEPAGRADRGDGRAPASSRDREDRGTPSLAVSVASPFLEGEEPGTVRYKDGSFDSVTIDRQNGLVRIDRYDRSGKYVGGESATLDGYVRSGDPIPLMPYARPAPPPAAYGNTCVTPGGRFYIPNPNPPMVIGGPCVFRGPQGVWTGTTQR